MEDVSAELAREGLFEAIENQIKDNNPPITKITYDRLHSEGFDREEVMKLIGCAMSVEIFDIMKNGGVFNEERYTLNLKGLPELPWDDEE